LFSLKVSLKLVYRGVINYFISLFAAATAAGFMMNKYVRPKAYQMSARQQEMRAKTLAAPV